jgi:hypothetical protein
LFSAPRNPRMESFRAMEPNAAEPGQAALIRRHRAVHQGSVDCLTRCSTEALRRRVCVSKQRRPPPRKVLKIMSKRQSWRPRTARVMPSSSPNRFQKMPLGAALESNVTAFVSNSVSPSFFFSVLTGKLLFYLKRTCDCHFKVSNSVSPRAENGSKGHLRAQISQGRRRPIFSPLRGQLEQGTFCES